MDIVENRIMANADYQPTLKNGIDAARSGSRMMARLHLLKAADLAPQDVAAHLWLAWVAETPADALSHLDEALSRQPGHALAKLGRLWTRLMAEYDVARDYAQCDLGELGAGLPEHRVEHGTVPGSDDVSRTQRLSGLTIVERREKKAHPVADGPADGPAARFAHEPLDLTRTVRMELLQRERPDESDSAEEPSPALTCIIPAKPARSPSGGETAREPSPTDANADANADAAQASTPGPHEELLSTGTIRLGPNAVKRALAEKVIAEMISPEYSAPPPGTVIEAEAEPASPAIVEVGSNARPLAIDRQPAAADATPRVDAYTEPPAAALAPEAPQPDVADAERKPADGPRVLVVDDSPTVRKLVTATLEAQGYRVACAASGYEAVEILAHATPDALVIEVDLPRLDGLHLCKLLRSNEATRHTPVVFLTRRGGTMDRMRGKMVGATAYLTKPFRAVALVEELATCCPAGRNFQSC